MEFFNDVGGDPLKPSLFELVAQEQLRDLLQPALRYVLAVCNSQSEMCPKTNLIHRSSLKDIHDICYALSIDMKNSMHLLCFLWNDIIFRSMVGLIHTTGCFFFTVWFLRCFLLWEFLWIEEKAKTVDRNRSSPSRSRWDTFWREVASSGDMEIPYVSGECLRRCRFAHYHSLILSSGWRAILAG